MTGDREEAAAPTRSGIAQITWLATIGFSSLAGLAIIVNIDVIAVQGIGKIAGWPPFFSGFNHLHWLLIAGFCAAIAVVAHLIKLRAGHLSNLVYPVELDGPVVAETRGGTADEQFRSRADITIELTTPDLVDANRNDMAMVRRLLEHGLSIATSDPINRFSKSRIEDVLKLCLAERYRLSDIHRIVLTSMRQERMVPNFESVKAAASNGPAPSENATPNGAETAEAGTVEANAGADQEDHGTPRS